MYCWRKYGTRSRVGLMLDQVTRGKRLPANQPSWVQLMVLTAHQGLCVFCSASSSVTIDHQEPVADGGADIWWNYLPACSSCNRRKNKKTAQDWVIDMKMAYSQPKAYRGMKKLPLGVCNGLMDRVRSTQDEIRDYSRREWFRHHYGTRPRSRNQLEVLELVASCKGELATYPYAPWKSPEQLDYPFDSCTRKICCAYKHKDWSIVEICLTDAERKALEHRAFELKIHRGDLVTKVIRQYLEKAGPKGVSPTEEDT
ncbi:HNH endonuclease [Streptomyces rubiginosohelvolus]|uniref:HNH endonuclease n=1 Tax=Streptomyces rubiginosohelvolus TaxID=67362 RepID=UPI0027E3F909|nr:HNH endonuclease signature motif containing protein [Streptomyces rubiginosohelvolus]